MAKINRDSKNVCNDALPAGMEMDVRHSAKVSRIVVAELFAIVIIFSLLSIKHLLIIYVEKT
jgi:hypothetical protein